MPNVVDSIASGATPSDIAQEIKDILYAKAAERVDDYRQVAASSMFDGAEDDTTDSQSEE